IYDLLALTLSSFRRYDSHRDLHSFPTRRSSDLVDEEKVKILQEADDIFIEELYKNNLYEQVSQAFVVLLPVKSVGVMGDERTYEYTAVVRSANTIDFMTATFSKFPWERSEEHTSELQSRENLVCRLLIE